MMYGYLNCICSLFGCCVNSKEKQLLIPHDKDSEGDSRLTAEDITNRIIGIFNPNLAKEIAGLFIDSALGTNIGMREQKRDTDRMRHEVTHSRTRSSDEVKDIEKELRITYLALGQNCDSNIQFCIYKELHKKFPKHIINLIIAKTEHAAEALVVHLKFEDARLIEKNSIASKISLNLGCKIAVEKKTDSIMLQLIDLTTSTPKSLVKIEAAIENSHNRTVSYNTPTVSFT